MVDYWKGAMLGFGLGMTAAALVLSFACAPLAPLPGERSPAKRPPVVDGRSSVYCFPIDDVHRPAMDGVGGLFPLSQDCILREHR